MNEIGVFTPEQARLLWQDYQTRQALAPQISKNLPLRRQIDEVSPHRVFIRNDAGETLPAYGCAQITGVAVVGGRTAVTVDKPSDSDSEYLFNCQFALAAGEVGWAYRFGVVVMLGDPPSGANVQYGPTVGQWTIAEGSGPFTVFGEHDTAGTVIGRFAAAAGLQMIRFSLLEIDPADPAKWTATVLSRPPGVARVTQETEAGTVVVVDMLGCLLADEAEADLLGRQGYATYLESEGAYGPVKQWEVHSLCCPT